MLRVCDADVEVVAHVGRVGVPGGRAHHRPRHAHPIEEGHVEDGGQRGVIQGLGAVRPEVLTLSGVHIAGGQRYLGWESSSNYILELK